MQFQKKKIQDFQTENGDLVETVDMREINKQKTLSYYRDISDLPNNFKKQTFENAICKNDTEKKHKESFMRFCNNFERIKKIDNEFYLVGKDVAEILGYKDTSKAITRHVEEDDRMKCPVVDNIGS